MSLRRKDLRSHRASGQSENHQRGMATMIELDRLKNTHKQLQGAMEELIDKKNYSEAERLLHIVDKLMLGLIKDAGGLVVDSERSPGISIQIIDKD
jgi:hypothetical protein